MIWFAVPHPVLHVLVRLCFIFSFFPLKTLFSLFFFPNSLVKSIIIIPLFYSLLIMAAVLNEFLARSAEAVKSNAKNLVVVTGNEGGDMDSVIGAIFLAFFLNQSKLFQLGTAVPVINFPLEDIPLRNDVYNLLKQHSVNTENILSIQKAAETPNYIDIQNLGCSVVLYDHNKLIEPQSFLASKVIGIVDHHFDEKLYEETSKQLRIIRTVGSAATLVAELFKAEHIVPPCPAILAAPIITDTTDFKEEQKKVTPADVAAYEWLKSVDGNFSDSHVVFKQLSAWKKDIFGLTIAQNFRRDYKEFNFDSVVLQRKLPTGISSIPCSYEKFIENYSVDAVIDASADFVNERRLQTLILAFAGKKDGEHTRDVAFFGAPVYISLFRDFVSSVSSGVIFTITEDKSDKNGNVFQCYSLNDPSVSRKRLSPSLAKYLSEGIVSSL